MLRLFEQQEGVQVEVRTVNFVCLTRRQLARSFQDTKSVEDDVVHDVVYYSQIMAFTTWYGLVFIEVSYSQYLPVSY